jgi:trimeric autotransporter adhesin
VRLVCVNTVRRFVGLTVLLFFALPFGLSVAGCGHKSAPVQFCNAGDSGPIVGQVASITLASNLATTGESLNYGQIGTALSANAVDCKGNAVSVKSFTYASTSSFSANSGVIFADINPANGTVCGGTWNRNTGGGIADFTTCSPPSSTPIGTTTAVKLTTPTAATATTAATTQLVLANGTDFVSGTLALTLAPGTCPVPTPPQNIISIAPYTTLTALASQINSNATFVAAGITAAFNPNVSTTVLTINGPVGSTNTLCTNSTALIDSVVAFQALVTATANGAVSNAIPIYVHPVVTGAELGPATAANSASLGPGTDSCPNDTVGTPVATPAGIVDGNKCLSQTQVGQLVARVYQGGVVDALHNITCEVGHLTFAAQTPSIVGIDENGAATAEQPGSTVITATVANSSTATQAGFFSTCPPASIVLSVTGKPAGTNSVNVAINNLQPLTATVLDTQNFPISGLSLEFNSTTPQTIPTAVGSVTPAFPGSADITAVCQPTTCNTAPFSQIGLFGNGKPITSNPITINAIGTSSTVLYMGSTNSQYIAFRDFTVNQPSALLKLPYVPNSMVMNQAGTQMYLGSTQGLMTVNTSSNALGTTNQSIPGVVLSVSPDGNTVVVTDPTRQTISLVSVATSAVSTSYGGIGTSAAWSPDDQAVYITTTTGAVLTHSPFTDWQMATADETYTDVAVSVPSIGAFFAGPNTTDGRSYCASSVSSSTDNPPVITNQFLPLADQNTVATDQIAATTNGTHILGAHAAGLASTFSDIDVTLPTNAGTGSSTGTSAACPAVVPTTYFQSTVNGPLPLTGVNAATITGVVPSSNSAVAFVTYTLPNGATTGGGTVPLYFPPATGVGTLQFLTLANGATALSAPVSGIFSTDNFTFYTGTSGDNQVHMISLTYPTGGAPVAAETPGTVLAPQLPAAGGTGNAVVNLLAQHPKKSTS